MSDELTDDSDDSSSTRRKSSSRSSPTSARSHSPTSSRRDSSTSTRRNSPATPRRASSVPPYRSEFDFIERIRRQELRRLSKRNNSSLITHHSSLLTGIGDDAAIVRQRAGFDTIITADMLVEGIDFRLEPMWMRARDLGHKALAVS